MGKRVKPPKLVFVVWIDAAVDSGWLMTPVECTAHLCHSVGWLVKDTKREIVLAADISNDTLETGIYDTNRRIAIPRAWIKTIREISHGTG